MMKLRFLFALFLTLMISSCGKDYGNQIKGGELTVHYSHGEDEGLAEQLALFWKENNLIVEGGQDIQLYRDREWLQVRIIANDPEKKNQMSFQERSTLIELQKKIQQALGANQLQLVICDRNFKPIYNINQ